MAIHYPKNLVGRCKAAKLVPVSIGIGADIHWQGGVDTPTQLRLLAMLQECQRAFPLESLPPPVRRVPKAASIDGATAASGLMDTHPATAAVPSPTPKKK